MQEWTNKIIRCSNWQGIVAATNAIVRELPPDARKRLNAVFSANLRRYGIEGVFERLNGQSVGTILNEYTETANELPIATGEVEGVRYSLYERPRENRGTPRSVADGQPAEQPPVQDTPGNP